MILMIEDYLHDDDAGYKMQAKFGNGQEEDPKRDPIAMGNHFEWFN